MVELTGIEPVTVSEDDDFQARDLPEATPVACGHAIAQGNRGGTDQEIMGSDASPFRGEACPKCGMDSRGPDVEGEHREHGEEPLDKRFTALALRDRGRPVDAVQEPV